MMLRYGGIKRQFVSIFRFLNHLARPSKRIYNHVPFIILVLGFISIQNPSSPVYCRREFHMLHLVSEVHVIILIISTGEKRAASSIMTRPGFWLINKTESSIDAIYCCPVAFTLFRWNDSYMLVMSMIDVIYLLW